MRYSLLNLLLTGAALAQTTLAPPLAGTIRDATGALHSVVGVAGNFVVLDAGISNVVSAAFSGSAGLVKTDSQLLVLDALNNVQAAYDAPPGPGLFAFDAQGAPALAYYSGMLYRIDSNGLAPVNWTGDVVSLAVVGPQWVTLISRNGGELRNVRINLATGDAETGSGLADAGGPMLLLPAGGLLFTRDGAIAVRDSNGAERLLPAGLAVDYFEPMNSSWIAVRESGPGRLFALRITPRTLDLYQLPEVTQ